MILFICSQIFMYQVYIHPLYNWRGSAHHGARRSRKTCRGGEGEGLFCLCPDLHPSPLLPWRRGMFVFVVVRRRDLRPSPCGGRVGVGVSDHFAASVSALQSTCLFDVFLYSFLYVGSSLFLWSPIHERNKYGKLISHVGNRRSGVGSLRFPLLPIRVEHELDEGAGEPHCPDCRESSAGENPHAGRVHPAVADGHTAVPENNPAVAIATDSSLQFAGNLRPPRKGGRHVIWTKIPSASQRECFT